MRGIVTTTAAIQASEEDLLFKGQRERILRLLRGIDFTKVAEVLNQAEAENR
jgi:hypothetical protein